MLWLFQLKTTRCCILPPPMLGPLLQPQTRRDPWMLFHAQVRSSPDIVVVHCDGHGQGRCIWKCFTILLFHHGAPNTFCDHPLFLKLRERHYSKALWGFWVESRRARRWQSVEAHAPQAPAAPPQQHFSLGVKSDKQMHYLNLNFFFPDSPLISMRFHKIRQGSHPSVLLTFSNNIYHCRSVKTIKSDDIYAKGS